MSRRRHLAHTAQALPRYVVRSRLGSAPARVIALLADDGFTATEIARLLGVRRGTVRHLAPGKVLRLAP